MSHEIQGRSREVPRVGTVGLSRTRVVGPLD